MSSRGPFKRILLKISGESFGRETPFEMDCIHEIAKEIVATQETGKQVGIVVGGGNIVRGAQLQTRGIQRVVGDYMGMLSTVVNALALEDILKDLGAAATIMTARRFEGIGEPYHREDCLNYLNEGHIVIFAGGTGSPFFTTDTAAALKAAEIKAEVLFKATKVDGIYDKDPSQHDDAVKFDFLAYQEVLAKRYKVMDSTAIAFCLENKIPVLVFNLMVSGNLTKAAAGEEIGTLVANSQ